VKLYLFPHPDTDTTIGVLAHSRKEALKLLKEQREDVYIITLMDDLSPAVLEKPTLLYVVGVSR